LYSNPTNVIIHGPLHNVNLMYNICCGSILSLVQFYLPLFLGMAMYDNEFKTKENKIWTEDKIEPQHIHKIYNVIELLSSVITY